MPSRKRNKGRARKEKKARETSKKNDDDHHQQHPRQYRRQQQGQQAPSQELQHLIGNLTLEENSTCSHGFPPLPAGNILHTFIRELDFALHRVTHYYNPVYEFNFVACSLEDKNLMVLLGIEDYQEQLSSSLVSLGANYLLRDTDASHLAGVVAMFVIVIESGGYVDWANSQMAATLRDFGSDTEREATRFFSKRIKCSCLKGKYKQVKSGPKVGICHNCNQEKERKELLLCTGCRVAHYCSEECQRADWPRHKGNCIRFKSPIGRMTP